MARVEQFVLSEHFLATVRRWFETRPDIFVVVRYSAMAGAREYFWLRNFDTLQTLLNQWPPQTDVIVCRDNPFPIRGVVTDDLIQQIFDLLPGTTEGMIARGIQAPDENIYVWYTDNHADIKDVLEDLIGEEVSAGVYPAWHKGDHDTMMSALIPLPDGTLKRGVY